ncbi:ribosomal protein S18-alanine N-acetyltransferase [Brevundimonas sp. VNH65]|uniref:ribosomal protein S18-alanine N-acetyltransferase n=1 Tax=Brevundimonas sp. VNH65 TaxID=3400917 RepID=UPI003C0C78C8
MTADPDPAPIGPANAPVLAGIHAQAFAAPWASATFADLLDQSGVFALAAGRDGFILCRVVADEAEVLTLAVRPDARRSGLGLGLVRRAADHAAAAGAARLFLEVAEDNAPALKLYDRAGFRTVGRRRGYYPRPDGAAVDALILAFACPAHLPSA